MNNRKRSDISTLEPTRYEVALMRGSEVLKVLGYTARKSKHGVLALCTKSLYPYMTQSEIQETETRPLTYSRKHGFEIATNVFVRFTGKTERETATR